MFYYEIEIDGMKCGMCEAHVNDLIRKEYNNAKRVKSSHKKNLTSFCIKDSIDTDKLKEKIESLGYRVYKITIEEK